MLFRLIWDEETKGIFSLPDILFENKGNQKPFWFLSPALPFIFIEEMSAGWQRSVKKNAKKSSRQDLEQRQKQKQKEDHPYNRQEKYGLCLNRFFVYPGVPAHQVYKQVSSSEEVLGSLKKAARELGMSLPKMNWQPAEIDLKNIHRIQDSSHNRSLYKNLALCLQGRHMADAEVLRLAQESACQEKEIWRFLQSEVSEGRAVWLSAVGKRGWGMACRRCGCPAVEEWPGFYQRGYSCGECAALGGMSSLNVLWRCQDNTLIQPRDKKVLNMPFALSQAQEKAARELEGTANPRVLVWAACGAGKTEVCFSRMAQALEEGKRVLFAAPRQDVIHDLAPRLAAAFPQVDKTMLSGASPIRFTGSPLVAATTHQVARFYQAFDLIIMDELDAFPFTDGDFLRRALTQALRPEGDIVYLTATPDPRILREIRANRCGLIQLPARHHRQPLPVPVWKKCMIPSWDEPDNVKEKGEKTARFPKNEIRDVLARLTSKGVTLFFVPRIADVLLWIKWLSPLFPQKNIDGSWSSDPDRREKIEALGRGSYDIFVTTTILERGITLDAAQVAVVWANHPLFEDRTLVQMAGRAGRKQENPDGEVVFLAEQCSRAMQRAEKWIIRQNSLALKLGLIDVPAERQK